MSGSHSDNARSAEVNPFSPTAVARVAEFAPDTVTIPTPAIREAVRLLDGYLDSPQHGNVIAIVGDYGTGKTHLAVELLQHANRRVPEVTKTIYLDAPAGTFVALYRRFIEQLELRDVRERVQEYYADIVADALSESAFGMDLAQPLRAGEIDPVEVVSRLGLMESSFLQQVQRKLEDVTHNEAFGTALTLLLRHGFDDVVWEWLTGHEPDQILADRGIASAVDTDAAALEAMGVFALLYGHRNRRFIVVIDELDKVLSAANRPTEDAIEGFKKLLEVFAGARAMLVLAGLPDYLEVLSGNARQRIGRVITASALSAENTIDFIRESRRRAHGEDLLEPFTVDTVNYLVKLTDGIARKIVRLCYQLYRKATEQQRPVTVAMVHEVALNNQFDHASIDDVRNAIRRVLNAQGSTYRRDQLVGLDENSRADYWIPVGRSGSGCALLLTESVLTSEDSQRLARRATAIRNAAGQTEALLVVVGYLPTEFAAELGAAFGAEPLVYDHWTFNETLASALAARIRGLESVAADDPLEAVQERLGRMSRQQANTQRFIEQLAIRLEDTRNSSDRQLAVLQRELAGISDTLYAAAPRDDDGARVAKPLRLPAEVARLFDDAVSALDSLSQVVVVLRAAFVSTDEDPARGVDVRDEIRDWLRSQKVFPAVGVAVLLSRLVVAFRDGIADWYRSAAPPTTQGQLYIVDRERLSTLCRTYDVLYEYLPLIGLEVLGDLATSSTGTDDLYDQTVRSSARLANIRETLDGLGSRIHNAMLESFAPTN
ncbi:AAA family ATPase [Saccharopolyspora sp. 5N708]|uniref:AAA family ATPase n=1 Tax=Saccharopolyspora sp. 5N708 TaxID=3457424 RepID=UPI003FD54E4E